MHPSDPLFRALTAPSTLPAELTGLDSDPLWAALLTSVQNVVLGEIRAEHYPELGDESQRDRWPQPLDRLGHDARVRIGREIIDELTVGTVDELWESVMRVLAGGDAGAAAGATNATGDDSKAPDASREPAATSPDPVVQERVMDLLELLGEIVDDQLADRFGALPEDPRPEAVEFSLSDAGPAPEPITGPAAARRPAPVPAAMDDAGLVVSLPTALAGSPTRAVAVPAFDWSPGPAHPDHPANPDHPAHPDHPAPPDAPGWRPLPTALPQRAPASVGRRAAAFLIDRAIGILVTTAAALLLVWPAATSASSATGPDTGGLARALALPVAGVAVAGVGWLLVAAWLTGTRGASPGKRLMRIEVTGYSSPGPIGFGRALLRELILAVFSIGSVLTAWLPYASVLWDPAKQLRGWHDRAVDDIVADAVGP
jgi:uncharacterized RDD family membrane protein YckC